MVFDGKVFINNSRFMEFIDEIATQITEMNFGADTWLRNEDGVYVFSEEAQEYYTDKYNDYEMMANNIMGIHSDNDMLDI